VGNPVAALIGFACVGVGLSNVVPVVFSAAGQTSGIANGAAIAAVATAGYLGFIVGPPVIGYVSQATSLPLGLGIVVVFLSLIAVLADNVRPTGGAGRSTSTDRRPR
jgi:MFS family permease